MSEICASVRGSAGIPLSGRPLCTTSPIKSPFTSCATTGDRNKSGPRAPVASAPWQNAQEAVNCVSPRAASGFSGGAGRRCFLSGAGPFGAAAGAAALAGFCCCSCGWRTAAVATSAVTRDVPASKAMKSFDLEVCFILHPRRNAHRFDAENAYRCGGASFAVSWTVGKRKTFRW